MSTQWMRVILNAASVHSMESFLVQIQKLEIYVEMFASVIWKRMNNHFMVCLIAERNKGIQEARSGVRAFF